MGSVATPRCWTPNTREAYIDSNTNDNLISFTGSVATLSCSTPDRPPAHNRRRCDCREDGHGKLRRPGFFPGGSSSDILRCRYSAVFRRRSTGTGVSSGYFWSRTKRELGSDPQPGASVPLRSAGKGGPTSGRAAFSRAVQRSPTKPSAGTIDYRTCFRR